jgi:hypothetical protein
VIIQSSISSAGVKFQNWLPKFVNPKVSPKSEFEPNFPNNSIILI